MRRTTKRPSSRGSADGRRSLSAFLPLPSAQRRRPLTSISLHAHRLSELLSLPLPVLPSLQSSLNPSFVTAGASGAAGAGNDDLGPQSLWADEEEKKFYEDLRELRGEVPAAILGVPEGEDKGKGKEDEEKAEPEAAQAEEAKEVSRIDDEPAEEPVECVPCLLSTCPARVADSPRHAQGPHREARHDRARPVHPVRSRRAAQRHLCSPARGVVKGFDRRHRRRVCLSQQQSGEKEARQGASLLPSPLAHLVAPFSC